MKRATAAAFVLLGWAVGLSADTLTLKDSVLDDVAIVDAVGGDLLFTKAGKQSRCPLAQIGRIKWDAHQNFNMAEDQWARGDSGTAMISYDQSLHYAVSDWERHVIDARRAMRKADIAAARAVEKAPASDACPVCGKKNVSPCSTCRGSGAIPCQQCNGTGTVVCPKCKGKWQDDKCKTCAGSGKVYAAKDPGISVVASRACPDCTGKGWRFVCTTCASSSRRGAVACGACGGSGQAGECPACKGRTGVCAECAGKASAAPAAAFNWLALGIGGGAGVLGLIIVGVVVARQSGSRPRVR